MTSDTADALGPDDRPRPPRADERACLTGFLALNRATVVRKARGLSDADGARRVLRAPPRSRAPSVTWPTSSARGPSS
ncbi:hypothetical protein CMsap09_10985 [Clavibacter michiganensis]|uniref:Uncharacterized protein n=1 Tax=Clavibacter michiganensis TaxID=28447 RepID=A0A251XVZ2_9MICO|nr:hypothetical protein CMsap09_10985 [Clavibacter michiganensis]